MLGIKFVVIKLIFMSKSVQNLYTFRRNYTKLVYFLKEELYYENV
ncbi:hypothetical protein CLFO_27390 [Clostridium formicaceticum]|uniref:Uncharacterized protein n=1 Tax=Clostridium formicaceticum TaxID=1497 RepID=A0AAC9RN99_9CLOT|nr:hypothetical protein CLFO_27390 [Clostridium formicaceticum]